MKRRETSLGSIGLLAALIGLHLLIVASIARQPLNVNQADPSKRSLVWPLFNDSVHRIGPMADFLAVYHAGLTAVQGLNPYEQRENPGRTPYFFEFRYLPAAGFLIGAPLTLLSPRGAGLVWMLVLELILAGFALFWWRAAGPGPARWGGLVVLLLSTPFFLELHMGQFTFAAIALSAAALILLGRREGGRPARSWIHAPAVGAALCFTLAVLLKVFPLVLAPVLLRRGRPGWITLGSALAALVLLNAPYFASHPGTWETFYKGNFGAIGAWQGMHSGNFSLVYVIQMMVRDLAHFWSPESWDTFVKIWRVLVLGTASVAVLISPRRDVVLAGGLMLLAHFLSYHHVWEHHLSGVVLILLLCLWRVEASSAERRPSSGTGGAAGVRAWAIGAGALWAAAVLMAMPTPFVLIDRALDPRVADPAKHWSAFSRYCLPLFKVVPLLLGSVAVAAFLFTKRTARRAPAAAKVTGTALIAILSLLFAGPAYSRIAGPAAGDSGSAGASGASAARFEPFLDLQLAKGFPVASDLRISQPGLGTKARFHGAGFRDESFETPPWYSVRGGLWLRRPSWLGVAAEFVHPKLYLRRGETLRLSGTWQGIPIDTSTPVCTRIQQFSLSHGANRLFLDLLFRRTLLGPETVRSSGRPGAGPRDRIRGFAGLGFGANIPHTEIRIDGMKLAEKYEFAGPAWQVFAGADVGLRRWASALLEYKYTGGEFEVEVFQGTAAVDGRAHLVTAGLRIG